MHQVKHALWAAILGASGALGAAACTGESPEAIEAPRAVTLDNPAPAGDEAIGLAGEDLAAAYAKACPGLLLLYEGTDFKGRRLGLPGKIGCVSLAAHGFEKRVSSFENRMKGCRAAFFAQAGCKGPRLLTEASERSEQLGPWEKKAISIRILPPGD